MHADTPYADLTPDLVLDALEALGQRVDGRLLQLNSYENRVFQIGLDSGEFVVAKFYRPGRWSDAQILEEHAFSQELVAAEVPAVPPITLQAMQAGASVSGLPPTLGHFKGHRVAVSPRRGGRSPELEDPEVLTWLGRFLARLHLVGAQRPFTHRLSMGVEQTGRQARQWLADSEHSLPIEQRANWLAAADQALDLCQQAFDRVDGLRLRRLHGDCHPGNILWTPDGPHFVDLDDACMGPAIQDLWMMLSGDARDRQSQLNALLDGYESMAEFDWRELKLIEPLRTLRIIHHSAWLARRWHDPAFPAAFPWFESGTYWQQQLDLLRQQIDVMQTPDDQPAWMLD
ncbi:MAG: serine/threonine protein kinase [Aquabacterium sp.]|uniref:serine/threonine protein kinase n=1 Tax=Aquabacterium sp. TaxID=1872578 RepID=UPI0012027510|nr:serine/threonine protein kinase [Aquabacterium sp.]TAK99617.1 MAG: serine/threonine protein kinase [Aquabacterium sp.]